LEATPTLRFDFLQSVIKFLVRMNWVGAMSLPHNARIGPSNT
jgi:hypothetical protein